MLKNYVLTALRCFSKDRVFSAINMLGLATSLAVCILITAFITDEFSYDKFNDKADRIFRVICDIHINGNGINGNYAPPPLGPAMVKDFSQIENAVRIRKIDKMLVKKNRESILESNAVFADSSLFAVFTLPMITGDPHTALVEPFSIVISESIARKYFNSTNVLGKSLITDNNSAYKITGVIRDIPLQSHFHFDFIKAMSEKKNLNGPGFWLNPHSSTYLLAKPGVTARDVDQMLITTVSKYIGPQLQHDMHSSIADLAKNGDYFRYYSMPLKRIHLYSNVLLEFEANSSIQTVYIFIITAILILLIACINFINLSTARSAHRSKEVAIRKILGSLRSDLVKYFLIESTLTVILATISSVMIDLLLLPYFNQLTGKHFLLSNFLNAQMVFEYLMLALFVGLLAGSYPAFYLSAFRPIKVLTNKLSFRSGWLRDGLVVFQFTAAVFLIIGTFVIYHQLNYIMNRDLGYQRQQVLTVSNTNYLQTNARAFKTEVDKLPGVFGSTMTGSLPNRLPQVGGRGYFKDATENASKSFILGSYIIDADYVPFLGIKILKGRNFSDSLPTDSSGILINETAANLLGYAADPINKPLFISGSNPRNPEGGFRVLGVVKDFNAGSLHDKIGPIVFHLGEDISTVSFHVDMKYISQLLPLIKKTYHSFDATAAQPFAYSFMDDDFNNLYQADIRTGKVYLSFAIFAILIACLGLFGLIAYAAERKSREIGIRKILGASAADLISMLSKNFLKLILLAVVIACPVAYWAMQRWLENYAYKTILSWWIFPAAALLALLIAGFTVAYQALKAINANPSEALKTE